MLPWFTPSFQEALTLPACLLTASTQPPSAAALVLPPSDDIHFLFLHLLLETPKKRLEFSAGLALWTGCCAVPEPGGWRCWEGSRQASAPGSSSLPLDGFLAISLSHTRRHLLRSRLSEVLTAGALAVERNVGMSCDLQQYGLPEVDGLILTAGDSRGVDAHTWTSRPHCFHTLRSTYVLRNWLLPIFCLFPLAHVAASLLCLLYLLTRTGTNFMQLGWSCKQNNLLLNTHFFLVGEAINLFERAFSPLLLSSLGIDTFFFQSAFDNYWKWSNHPWLFASDPVRVEK